MKSKTLEEWRGVLARAKNFEAWAVSEDAQCENCADASSVGACRACPGCGAAVCRTCAGVHVCSGMTPLARALAGIVPGHLEPCAKCGVRVSGGEQPDGTILCPDCEVQRRAAADRRLPKHEALHIMGVPELYRDRERTRWLLEPWPRAWRAEDRVDPKKWRGDPWAVTLHGVNGSGKSMMAAHLLWGMWLAGARPVSLRVEGATRGRMWITEGELLDEDRNGYSDRIRYRSAAAQVALVIDEVGSTSSIHQAQAVDVVTRLLSHRYERRLPTLVTTHRHMRQARGSLVPLRDLAPAVYDRLREGLVMPFGEVGYRGRGPLQSAGDGT